MQEWQKQEWKNREQIAGLENAGVENSRADRRGGKCRSGKVGSDNWWKAVIKEKRIGLSLHAYLTSMRYCDQRFEQSGFLQRVSIAWYAERCINHSKSVRPSVCPSHAGTESKRLKLRSWGLHWRIAPWIAHYDNTPFWIRAGTNKDDLEWPWMPDSS